MDQSEEEEKVLRIQLRTDCPCKSKVPYNDCCRPYHTGKAQPATAEQLMRARYSAYFFRRVDYLCDSHHPDTREPDLKKQLEETLPGLNWVYLKVHTVSKGGADDKKGKVEFTVRYYMDNELEEMTEHSRFRRSKGKWKYYDDKG